MIPHSPLFWNKESAHCGVGFIASRENKSSHRILSEGIEALNCLEHRGGGGRDPRSGDGAGIMTKIPFDFLGIEEGEVALASLFVSTSSVPRYKSLEIFRRTFAQLGLDIIDYRDVPTNQEALSEFSLHNAPRMIQAMIKRPKHCRSLESFESLLFHARVMTATNQDLENSRQDFFFASLSCRTVVYKVLGNGLTLKNFYPDLQDEKFTTNFCLFHRRFSTNTTSSWDKVQPFRVLAHNGEINTIEGNKTWAITREKDSGFRKGEVIQHKGNSDSGNLNSMVEALRFRSSIPHISEIMAILIPPAQGEKPYYKFWSRAMEPWDGPALISFCDGKRIGARLDRNGFRPCRWTETDEMLYLGSEDGIFPIEPKRVLRRGALNAGRSVTLNLYNGKVSFLDPSDYKEYVTAGFDSRLKYIERFDSTNFDRVANVAQQFGIFGLNKEEWNKLIIPMITTGKNAIGSMGDTSALPPLALFPRTLSQHFFQSFAQVTNPPLDYLREENVTDLSVYLGRRPNVFRPKELLPLKQALQLPGPVLTLYQMKRLKNIESELLHASLKVKIYDTTFEAAQGAESVRLRLKDLGKEILSDVRNGITIAIFSDCQSNVNRLPIDPLLILRTVHHVLDRNGLRLRCSLVFETGHIKNSHDLACLLSFGASATCPYLLLQAAREYKVEEKVLGHQGELSLTKALEGGLLKIMSKMGISVLKSYKGSELFTPLGLSTPFLEEFFPLHRSLVEGASFEDLIHNQINRVQQIEDFDGLKNNFYFKEKATDDKGENHSISSHRSRLVHQAIKEKNFEKFLLFGELNTQRGPSVLRDLLDYKKTESSAPKIDDLHSILKTFGSGAMSFGALSALSQRDIFKAMKAVGGQSNSGEGGENPYYDKESITSSIKQIASGRFGVTGEYLINAQEIQIKMAQGAKPGEGGQLMGHKVSVEIAKARFAAPGIDLISPPPQHDIYSIEDLKQLIYELKQFNQTATVSVKLVSGKNIGQIAVGVVKAGADTIQISGNDGGTGAADLLSMKQAGLPVEIGLREVHLALVENNLRNRVTLRVDGSIRTGRDVVLLALMGGEQFDFGKMLLIAQGCVLARICEKNTCPVGITTHDPKFLARYTGSSEDIVTYLRFVAQDVQNILNQMGLSSFQEAFGRYDLLTVNAKFKDFLIEKNIKLDAFFLESNWKLAPKIAVKVEVSQLNKKIFDDYQKAGEHFEGQYSIKGQDRAVGAYLFGEMARSRSKIQKSYIPIKNIHLRLKGEAGGGLGVLANELTRIELEGVANDFVGKSLNGGKIIITPFKDFPGRSEDNNSIGNSGLYGATGGTLFVRGRAGDRFGVRNSGAVAVVEGAGLHACEYMTRGECIILGEVLGNIGAGMTGGRIFLKRELSIHVNQDFLQETPLNEEARETLQKILQEYCAETQSALGFKALENINQFFSVWIPKGKLNAKESS